MSDPLLSVENATKRFRTAGHEVVALADVSLAVEPGECHAIIGESGSGKSTLAGLILGLTQPSSGSIRFKGETLGARRRPLRLGLDVHRLGERSRRRERVAELLAEVGLPADYAARTPRGLSGGERQRVAIARALACEPELLVLDEPTSALDVLVQARVLNLLMRTRREHGLTYLFITHDLAVVRGIADRISVFERGRLVEAGSTDAIFAAPRNAYTRRLLGAVPVVTAEEARYRDRFRAEVDVEEG